MKILKVTLKVVVALFLMLIISPKKDFDGTNRFLKENNNNLPLVMAHRGGRGVFPGNTKSAFDYSYYLGVDVLELDVHMTSDGILVTRHGENETGNIRSMSNCDTVIWNETFEYLYNNCNFGYNFENDNGDFPYRALTKEEWVTAGVYMTTLEELFIDYGNNILYTIEIKADADAPREATADELVRLIELYELNEYVLAATAFDDIGAYIVDTYPEIMMSTSYGASQTFIIEAYTLSSSLYFPKSYAGLQLPTSYELPVINRLNLASKLLINTAHKHNMAVHYWTINDPDEMRRLIELGCDGIITDYPEVLMDIINTVDYD